MDLTVHSSEVVVPVGTAHPVAIAADGPVSVTTLLNTALLQGTPVEQMKELVALHERITEREAKQAFNRSFAEFQRRVPSIHKNKTANIATRGGGKFSYTYAELDVIAGVVNPVLAELGLSYTWDAEMKGGELLCVFILRHTDGHEQRNTVKLPVNNESAMSDQQKVGAALTFARRLSLVAGLGLTTTDDDADGRASEAEKITDEQADVLTALIEETGTNTKRFLEWGKVAKIADLPASRYREAVQMLEKKRGAK